MAHIDREQKSSRTKQAKQLNELERHSPSVSMLVTAGQQPVLAVANAALSQSFFPTGSVTARPSCSATAFIVAS